MLKLCNNKLQKGVYMKHLNRIATLLLALVAFATFSVADSAREIDVDANEALATFYHEVPGGKKLLEKAKAYVIFPDVNEASFFFGGQYGEGALRVDGQTKSYHSITALSAGLQMGFQSYSLVIVFTSDEALKNFILDDDDWETDFANKFVLAEWTTEDDDVDKVDFGASYVGFAYDATGMIGKLSMEGVKFEHINPDDD